MKFEILWWRVTIERRAKTLAQLMPYQVEEMATKMPRRTSDIADKIARIKAVRALVPGTKLIEANDWVERNFQ